MNVSTASPSSQVGGRAVLDEAVRVASADLETGVQPQPFVVTKDWGDCEVERFAGGQEEARIRMAELLRGPSAGGHCAFAHVTEAGHGRMEIVIALGRMGGQDVEIFVQRFRPKRGLFRPFKLIGEPARAPESADRFAALLPSTGDGTDKHVA